MLRVSIRSFLSDSKLIKKYERKHVFSSMFVGGFGFIYKVLSSIPNHPIQPCTMICWVNPELKNDKGMQFVRSTLVTAVGVDTDVDVETGEIIVNSLTFEVSNGLKSDEVYIIKSLKDLLNNKIDVFLTYKGDPEIV